jgi:CHASE2 domain
MNARAIAAALLLLATATAQKADDFASRFSVVLIDDATEAKLGAFPYDRGVIARAVEACAHAGARAVVLKFFFDRPKSAAGDADLCEAMTKIPVVLQARLDSSEGTTRPIPEKFRFAQKPTPVAVKGDRGWIPLPGFMDSATAVGFVDFDGPTIPLVEEYRGVAYRSLVLCCLELALQAPARAEPNRIYIGKGFLPVSALNSYQADISRLEPLKPISFARLLSGEVERTEIENRVVIIGLDSAGTPTVATEHGRMKIHRFFIQCLAASYYAVQANQTPEPAPAQTSDRVP